MNISPNTYQRAVLAYRGHVQQIYQLGGRGSSKSWAMVFDILMTAHELGQHYRGLVVRESHGGLQQISDITYQIATAAFGPDVSRNQGDGTIKLPNGAVVVFAQISDPASYARHQGTSIAQLCLDEVGNYSIAAWRLANRLKSNLRVPSLTNFQPSVHATGNPGGPLHNLLRKQFVSRGYWKPWVDDFGELTVVCNSTYRDNAALDGEAYRRRLEASVSDDFTRRAWCEGTFDIPAGGLFDDVWDPNVHVIPSVPYLYRPINIVGADFGQTAPCCGLLIQQTRERTGPYERGSIFVTDETHTCMDFDQLNLGSNASAAQWADQLKSMLRRNSLPLSVDVVQDDQRGLSGETVVSIMQECGLSAYRPRMKDRVGGWALIRNHLSASKRGEGPGLYIHERCKYLLATLPELQRGLLKPDDCDPNAPDHAADALRMGLTEIMDTPAPTGAVVGMY